MRSTGPVVATAPLPLVSMVITWPQAALPASRTATADTKAIWRSPRFIFSTPDTPGIKGNSGTCRLVMGASHAGQMYGLQDSPARPQKANSGTKSGAPDPLPLICSLTKGSMRRGTGRWPRSAGFGVVADLARLRDRVFRQGCCVNIHRLVRRGPLGCLVLRAGCGVDIHGNPGGN